MGGWFGNFLSVVYCFVDWLCEEKKTKITILGMPATSSEGVFFFTEGYHPSENIDVTVVNALLRGLVTIKRAILKIVFGSIVNVVRVSLLY